MHFSCIYLFFISLICLFYNTPSYQNHHPTLKKKRGRFLFANSSTYVNISTELSVFDPNLSPKTSCRPVAPGLKKFVHPNFFLDRKLQTCSYPKAGATVKIPVYIVHLCLLTSFSVGSHPNPFVT